MNVARRTQSGNRPTIQDVADAAGVSLKSVSRVINGEAHVSQKLRTKVEKAIRELAYVPDMAARSLAGGRNFNIALLFDNPSPSYTMQIQTGAYEACRKAGYHLRIDNLDSSVGEEELDSQLTAILSGRRADGYVLTPPLTDDPRLLDRLDAQAIPYVRIAPVIRQGQSLTVDFDDTGAARAAADHFLSLGHRRFGIVAGPQNHGRAPKRQEGFTSRLREAAPRASITIAQGSFEFASGLEAGRQLLEMDDPPTAIFAANDDMAAGVVSAAMQLGFKIPEEVSVCGFDDSWIAQSVWPPLTTICQPIRAMAKTAVELLLERKPAEPRTIALDFSLIERQSTAPPRG